MAEFPPNCESIKIAKRENSSAIPDKNFNGENIHQHSSTARKYKTEQAQRETDNSASHTAALKHLSLSTVHTQNLVRRYGTHIFANLPKNSLEACEPVKRGVACIGKTADQMLRNAKVTAWGHCGGRS